MGLGGFAAGFAKGLSGSIHEGEVRRQELAAKQKSLATEMLLKHGLENPGVADTPEFQSMLGDQFGKQAPAIQKVFEFAKAAQLPSIASLLGESEAAPAAPAPTGAIPGISAPGAITETPLAPAPMGAPTPTPPLGAVPPAAAPTAAPAGASPLARMQARLPEGVAVPIKTREGTIRVTGRNQKEADERAYRHAWLDTYNGLLEQGMDRASAGQMAHEVTAQTFIGQERSVPKDAISFLQADSEQMRKNLLVKGETFARKEVERQFREEAAGAAPGAGVPLIEAEAGARARGGAKGKETAAAEAPIPTNEVGRWFGKDGSPLPADTALATARKSGTLVTATQLASYQQLTTAEQFLSEVKGAGDVLFKTNDRAKAAGNSIRYRANIKLRTPGPETQAAVALQEARNNLIAFLRAGFGERGNFAARIADNASKSFVDFRETRDTYQARMNFMAGIVAATRRATGVPLKPTEEKLFRDLDLNAKRIGLDKDFGSAIGQQIIAHPGPENASAPATQPPKSAAEEFADLLGASGAAPQ